MSDIVLLDTSVYLNVLDVPGRNQQREAVWAQFEARIRKRDHFLLPMASILETGNHISRLPDGNMRREYAQRLGENVRAALEGETPFRPTYFPDNSVFAQWLKAFPDHAQRNKSPQKTTEGISLSDLSIIKEWEQTRVRHPMSRVLIWSLDSDLAAYDTGAC